MKIQNAAPGRRIIAGKYDLGKGEVTEIPNDEWASIVKCQAVRGMIEAGDLVVNGAVLSAVDAGLGNVVAGAVASEATASQGEASLYDAPAEDKPKKRSKGS